MFSMIWPIGLVVLSNILYNICAKSAPSDMDAFASLTVVYLVGAVTSAIFYFIFNKNGNLLHEYTHINWATVVLGIDVVGLEFGWICAYQNGWAVSSAALVQSVFLALGLLIVGVLLYHESISWNKIVGMAVCLVGLYFINR